MVENLRLAFRGIRSHKLRSFLTMLGVIIGIASIITIVSVVEGANKKLEESLIGAGNNVVAVVVSDSDGFAYDFSRGVPFGFPPVSDEAIAEIAAVRGVVSVSRCRTRNWQRVRCGSVALQNVNVAGVDNSFFTTAACSLVAGRGFSDEELKNGGKFVIVDAAAASALLDTADPLGKTLEINGEPFVIIGVVRAKNSEQDEYESINDYYQQQYGENGLTVYVPCAAWPLLYGFDEPETVTLRTESADRMSAAGRAAAEVLNRSVTNEALKYASQSTSEDMGELKTLTNVIRLVLVAVAGLSLLVGGIGIMNIMLVSVTERTSEIGLKKALGAKRRTILNQFLTESAVLTGVGGILGVLIGLGLAAAVSVVTTLPFIVSVPWIVLAVAFSVAIGILFGMMPASRAAKLDPIEALRRE